MQKEIMVGNNPVAMRANGRTPIYYEQVFGEDLFEIVMGKTISEPKAAKTYSRLGFIMAMQAREEKMDALTIEAYYDWLEGFGPQDLNNSVEDIFNLYADNNAQDTVSK